MSLPLAFFAKTSRLFEITKVPCFAGFLSTGRGWGSSRGFDAIEVRRREKAQIFRVEMQRPAGVNQRVILL